MKLRYSPYSPYVRKVLVLAHETGQADAIEIVPTKTGPAGTGPGFASDNPLMKIPTLILADGSTLMDSPVIAEYLDAQHEGAPLFPPPGPERWRALRLQALADGLLDAALLIRTELNLRPQDNVWQGWIDMQMTKINQALAAIEAMDVRADSVTIGEIAAAVALGYLDLRFPDQGWRGRHAGLVDFYEDFARRPSMQATRPPTS